MLGEALIIWNDKNGFNRLDSPLFRIEKKNSHYEIAGEGFDMEDGLFGLALSPNMQPNGRLLVFRPLASKSIYAAYTADLKNSLNGEKMWTGPDFLPSQATTMAFSADGTLFYALTGQTAIGCWHLSKPWSLENFVINDFNL